MKLKKEPVIRLYLWLETEKGHELMKKFDQWFEEVEFFALERAKKMLPFNSIGFNEPHQENGDIKKRKPSV